MNMKLVRCVATLSAAAGLALSARAAEDVGPYRLFDFPFVRGDKSNRSHLCRMFGKCAIPDT